MRNFLTKHNCTSILWGEVEKIAPIGAYLSDDSSYLENESGSRLGALPEPVVTINAHGWVSYGSTNACYQIGARYFLKSEAQLELRKELDRIYAI